MLYDNIGFMQGRLSDLANNKIQSFPWTNWQQEFVLARELNLRLMEWTLDYHNFNKNPFIDASKHNKIRYLSDKYSVRIESITCDCFMQLPFWKASSSYAFDALISDFKQVCISASELKVKYIVIPIVDNSSFDDLSQQDILHSVLLANIDLIISSNLSIIFEVDMTPSDTASFISRFPAPLFGINYDIGNSASLGYDPVEEIRLYGDRIQNVHVKDRILNGQSVPLGTGNADIRMSLTLLNEIGYNGSLILQTARSTTGLHGDELNTSIQFLKDTLKNLK